MNMLNYAEDEATLKRCFPVIQELRPQLTEATFLASVIVQREQGYRLAYIEQDGLVVACVGFRPGQFLAWGKVIYIDDLITASHARGQGHAGALLEAVTELAREQGCDSVQLDSGHQRFDAHRLYLNEGFRITSHHFSKSLKA